jgi:PKD repeat protein
MNKSLAIGFFKTLLIAVTLFLSGCHKDRSLWKPEAVLVMKPDSGLTTQTFDFRIDIPNLPSTQKEYYIRWDLNEDSVWDASFTALPVITHRFYQKGVHTARAEVLTKDGQRILLKKNIRIDQGYSAPHAAFKIDPPESNYLTEFTFDAGSTIDDEDAFSLLQFKWDFENDGSWDTESSSNPIAKHTYKKSGNYSVKLSVTDPTRRTATETKILIVNLHDSLIHPDFTWSSPDGTVKDTFLLDASATRHAIDSARVFTYTWDIDNEVTYGPYSDPKFSHMFWIAGMQKVTLTATDQNICENFGSE